MVARVSSATLTASTAAALAAAVAFGLASALQHAETALADQRGALDPALLTTLARRPRWLVGLAADVAAVALQAVALRYGPVSLVQPLLVAGLPVAVLLSAWLAHRRPSRVEAAGVALCTLGLALLLPAATAAGIARPAGTFRATVAGLVLVAVLLALLAVGRSRPRLRPTATGAAAGVVVGAGAVLLAVCAERIGSPGPLFRGPVPYLAVVVGLLGLLVSQAAFQTGALGAPLAALSIVEPVVAVLLAVGVLHERLPRSASALSLGVVGTLLAVSGVLVLARTQDDVPASS